MNAGEGKRRNPLHLTRDVAAFAIGAGLLAYEAILGTDRPNLIYAGVALIVAACFGRSLAAKNGEKIL